MKSYALAADFWEGQLIIIRSAEGTRIATFPLEFVQQGGVNNWAFVLRVIDDLVEIPPGVPTSLEDENGRLLVPEHAVWSGTFRFQRAGESSVVQIPVEGK